jgi:hypothetical protein
MRKSKTTTISRAAILPDSTVIQEFKFRLSESFMHDNVKLRHTFPILLSFRAALIVFFVIYKRHKIDCKNDSTLTV